MKIAVIGAGYVGVVSGACLAEIGHDVVCVDVSPDRVDVLNRGEAPIYEPGIAAILQSVVAAGRFSATTDIRAAMADADVSMIAVGTPSRDGEIDLAQVESAAASIAGALERAATFHTVVVKSTVVPGTTDTLVRNTIRRVSGWDDDRFGLCMNPEFLREGCAVDDFMNPDRIVIGERDARSGDVLARLYQGFDCPKPRVNLRNAELTKYASNLLLATLVSFSNELAHLCESLPGADVAQALAGVHLDKRWSPVVDGRRIEPAILSYLRAGIGYGGSCLPKDVAALRNHARALDVPMPMLDAVTAVNSIRPKQIVGLLERVLGDVRGRKVAVLGLAFKPDTDDMRESPAIPIVEWLVAAGARVCGYDPVAADASRAVLPDGVELTDDPARALEGAEGVVVTTVWPALRDWDWPGLITTMARPVFLDGRGVLAGIDWPAGVVYRTIGRGNP